MVFAKKPESHSLRGPCWAEGFDSGVRLPRTFKFLSYRKVLFDDCDYEKMIRNTIRSSFGNQGQICLCGSRIFIERSIYDRFKNDFVAIAKTLIPGPPDKDDSKMGAIVSKTHYEKILSYIELAKEEKIPLLVSPHSMFVSCGRLYNNGITGVNGNR